MLKGLKVTYTGGQITESWAKEINLKLRWKNFAAKQNPTIEDIAYILNHMDYKLGLKFRLTWTDEESGQNREFFVGSTEHGRVIANYCRRTLKNSALIEQAKEADGTIDWDKVVWCEIYDPASEDVPYHATFDKETVLGFIAEVLETGLPPKNVDIFPPWDFPPTTT